MLLLLLLLPPLLLLRTNFNLFITTAAHITFGCICRWLRRLLLHKARLSTTRLCLLRPLLLFVCRLLLLGDRSFRLTGPRTAHL